jgi:prepilin signal peptidase PulO-like enzyme (type II secretory pathway)
MRSHTVQAVPVSTIIGFLLGCASWVAAVKLTAGARGGGREERALLLLSGVSGGGVLAATAIRSGGDPIHVALVAILTIPLLITLLTDILDRLIFPIVLVPGLLVALAVAAAGSPGVPLPAALISGGGAAIVTGLLVAASRSIWSGSQEPPIGSGEIYIAATIGAMLGPDETPLALFAGVMLGAVAAGLLLLTRRARRQDVIPYGAFLCGSALVALAL